MIKENGEVVRCPKCNSTDVIAVMPFDYAKMCKNDKCTYYLKKRKKLRWGFSTGVHN